MLRVAVFATVAKGVFSGGRYHALMAAEVLARMGHETWFVTNNPPVFADDLAPIATDNPVRIVLAEEFDVSPAAPFDAVFVAPQMSLFPRMYTNAVRFAREAGAGLILINYESPNWFNAFSPVKRPAEKWREWRRIAEEGALVLSSTHESRKYAEDYYTRLPPESAFDVWQPAINSVVCASVPAQTREKLIVLFSRPSDAHKGGGDIADLIGPELRGYTIGLLIGNPQQAESFVEGLRAKGAPHGVGVQPYYALSDRQKFLLLKRAAAVVFPSYFEGYGYPPLEALACDTPCVAYDLPVVRENCGDLVRYVPLGDVAALRRELVAALAAGPVATSTDPRVVELTDVDARGRALERVILDYTAHRKRVRTTPFEVHATDFRITPASTAHVKRHPRVFFSLSAPRVIEAIEAHPAFVTAAQVLPGAWDGTAWRHDVVLTLADKSGLSRLRSVELTARFGCGRLRLSLAGLTTRRLPIRAFAENACALTKAFGSERRAILAGWLYPVRPYDGLLAMNDAGVVVRLHTAVKNLHYKTAHPVEPLEPCGFVSSTLDRTRFSIDHLRVFALDRGRVVGMSRLESKTVLAAPAGLPLIGTPSAAAAPDRDLRATADVDLGAVKPTVVATKSHAFAAPRVARPNAFAVAVGRARALVLERLGKSPKSSAASPPLAVASDAKWALSECSYLEDTGELVVRGWVDMLERPRIEIWDGNLNFVGVAVDTEPRPDVAADLKIADRDDLGFVFRTVFDEDLNQTMDVRLMFGPKLVARKIFDRIKPKPSTRLKVDDLQWDPQWSTLWMRGSFDAPDMDVAELRVCRGGETIATAALDRKFKPDGSIFFKWRVEETVATPPIPGERLTIVVTDAAGVALRIGWVVPPQEKWLEGVAKADNDLLYAESGDPLRLLQRFTGGTAPHDFGRRVLLVVHNLDAIERGEKREALMRLRAALNARGVELLVFHHARRASGCALPEINFFSPELENLVRDPKLLRDGARARDPNSPIGDAGTAAPSRPVVDDRTMNYAQRMLYGFVFALNRRPKPWSDIEKQTDEETAKLDVVIRLVDPDLVLVWHQWNSLMILARSIADRYAIPSAIIHEGMLPGTMTLDRRGMMAESEATGETLPDLPENAPFFARARAVVEEIRTRELDRKPQAGTSGAAQILARRLEPGMRSVFYAGVNDWQSGNLPSDHPRAKIHAPVYKETMAGLEALLGVAERQNFVVLFKPHPNLFPRPLELRHDRLIYVREASATDCITGTDVTVTLLSSLAYISLAHGKPTVLLGRNTLSGCHAAHELTDYPSIDDCLAAALAGEDMDRRRERFEAHVAALLKSRLFPYGDLTGFSMLSDDDTANEIMRIIDGAEAEPRPAHA